jgi:hypothetical protein
MQDHQTLEEIKEFFQSFLAPLLEGIRGDIRAIDAKIGGVDAKIGVVDAKLESYRRELVAEVRRVEEKMDVRLGAMDQKIEFLRKELVAEIRLAIARIK